MGTTPLLARRELRPQFDRCDSCRAQAFVRVVMPHDGTHTELLFCAHHARKHLPKLREILGVHVDDHREDLAELAMRDVLQTTGLDVD